MTTTFNPTQSKMQFIQDWNTTQFRLISNAITKHLKGKHIVVRNGEECKPYYFPNIGTKFSSVSNILGLAYTSSSAYAGYWVCSVQAYFDKDNIYHYVGFVIGTDNRYYALLNDKDENELIIQL